MIKTDYKCKHRRIALMAVILTAVFSISACNGKKDNTGSDTGNVNGSDAFGVSGNVSGGASSNGPEGKDDVEKSIRSMAAEYGVDMPEGIVSLADPNEIYESDNMIQMKNNDLFIAMKTASDWVDSEAGLSSGKKYISVPLELNDYGFGTTRTIPDASHFYIIEAKDGNGTILNLGAQGLRPKTDMPVSEIKSDPEQYYTSEKPYDAPNANVGMNLWLLYEVPADTKEITVACWINDEFSKPFDAAFRLKVKEKQVSQNFENQSGEEILKAVQTDERPDLSEKSDGNINKGSKSSGKATLNDFGWYFEDDFPIDGNVLTELQDLGGKWKGIINVVTPKEEGDQCRMLVGDVEVQYMGYKVTVLMTPRERYEFMVNNPEDMITLETKQDIGAMVMEGDWNDEAGYIDAETEGGLGVVIYDFVEAGGVRYAMGKVFNSDNEIGEIAMFR